MNATEAKKTLFEIRKNLIDDKQKHAIWLAIKAIDRGTQIPVAVTFLKAASRSSSEESYLGTMSQ